jgi:hypothetical protein
MPAPKGTRPPNAGKGRKKGAANKITKNLREMILGALEDAGGQAYLAEQARANPSAFLSLLGRIIPRETALTGLEGGPIQIEGVESARERLMRRIERLVTAAEDAQKTPANPSNAMEGSSNKLLSRERELNA